MPESLVGGTVKPPEDSDLPAPVREWCRKHYPSLLGNLTACAKLYRAINKNLPKKIGDIQEGEYVRLTDVVVVDRREYKYEGCPDTLKKAPCEDGSVSNIVVHRVELADETGSIYAVGIAPEFTEIDEAYRRLVPGAIVDVEGRARKRVNPRTGEESLELMLPKSPEKIVVKRDIFPGGGE